MERKNRSMQEGIQEYIIVALRLYYPGKREARRRQAVGNRRKSGVQLLNYNPDSNSS
jgi:hypothetical protein